MHSSSNRYNQQALNFMPLVFSPVPSFTGRESFSNTARRPQHPHSITSTPGTPSVHYWATGVIPISRGAT